MSREAAGSTVCPVLSLLRQTTFLTLWCIVSKVQECKRSLVQFLPWYQMCLLGLTPQKPFIMYTAQTPQGKTKSSPLCTWRVSVTGILAPPPPPSSWSEKGINYVRTGTSAYYSSTITSSPLTQGSRKQTDFVSPSATEPLSWSPSITQPYRGVMSTTAI